MPLRPSSASTMDFRNLGRPGSVSYIYSAPLDPDAFNKYQAHRWRMYGKQLEMEEALGDDLAREYALLRPKIAASLAAAWKLHSGASKVEESVIERKRPRNGSTGSRARMKRRATDI